MAMRELRGPPIGKGRRRIGMSRREARAAIAKMTEAEISKLATARSAGIGEWLAGIVEVTQ